MAILYEDYIKDKDKYDIYTPPKKKTTKKKKQNTNTLFKKSEGNLGQAIGYSALDALGNVTEGFLKGYEGISDWARNRGADIVDFFGADEYAKELRERSKEDDVADIVKQWNHITSGDLAGTKSEEELGNFKKVKANTVLGDKGGQVFQGIGNSLASVTTGMASGGALATPSFFMSASGNAETEALNAGATTGEARMYGLLSGTVEALSEKMFGGLGKASEKFGLGKGALDDQITNVFTKNMKSSLMKNITTLGLKSVGEGLEEVASGFGNALVQKLTYMNDEEIGQLLKDQNLMDSFVSGMLSSAIMQSPSTVKYTAQGRDINTGLTGTQQKYVNEIAQQRMAEAQKRNAKLNGYEQAKIEQRALTDFQKGRLADSNKLDQVNLPGITNKDLDLQQSAYKYGFNPNSEAIVTAKTMLDNRGIKSRFDADAFKNINGNAYWTNENGVREVIFNPNASEQAILEEIAIHELTHDLMSSENSQEIIDNQKIMDYVSTLDGYEEARAKVEKLYAKQTKGKTVEAKKAYIDEEIVADTLGKNIGSQEYIRRLIDDEPSIAKNIYDWVVNKVANKNGVKNEKAYWNNVKNNFEKAYNMEYQGKGSKNNTKFSIQTDKNGKKYVNIDTDQSIFEGLEEKDYNKIAKMYINEYLKGETTLAENDTAIIDSNTAKKYTNPGKKQSNFKEKMRLSTELKNVLEISEKVDSSLPIKDNSKYGKWEYYKIQFKLGNETFEGLVNIGIDSNNNKHLYEVNNIKKTSGISETSPNRPTGFSEDNVPQSKDNVKSDQKYSLSEQLENQASNLVEEDIQTRNAMLDNFKSYIEEYDITNPTQEDIDNSLIDLLSYDNDMTPAETLKYERQYNKVVNEYLNGNNDIRYSLSDYQEYTNEINATLEKAKNIDEKFYNDLIAQQEEYKERHQLEYNILEETDSRPATNENINSDFFKEHRSEYDEKRGIKTADGRVTVMHLQKGDNLAKLSFTEGEDKIWIDELYVKNQKQGYGSEIVNAIKKYAEENGKYVEAFKELSTAKGFWDKTLRNNADIRYSQQNEGWQSFLDNNFNPKGTKTRLGDIKLPGIQEAVQTEVQKSLLPIATELKELNKNLNKVLNPSEIAQLTPQDANTTPILPGINRNKVGDGKSKFFDNIYEKTNMLNDETKTAILSSDDVKYYDKVTNKESLDKAYARLQKNGRAEVEDWLNKTKQTDGKDARQVTSVDVAEGWILLKQVNDAIEKETDPIRKHQLLQSSVNYAINLRDIGSKAGQVIQAFNILSRLTPEGMVYYAQKELSQAYDEMVQNKTKAWIDENKSKFELQPNEVQFILDTMKDVSTMEDGRAKDIKLAQIQAMMKDKLPPSKGAGIRAWMRISMLFNPKTLITRNPLGNALMVPVNAVGDVFASGVDKLISQKTGVRTKGNMNVQSYGKGFVKGAKNATQDYLMGINTRNIEGNRFELTEGKSFNEQHKGMFKDIRDITSKGLNKADNMLGYVLDIGDRTFYEGSFENSLKNQMVLNNTTEVTQDMIDIATQEALSRTWQDNSEYTKAVLGIRNTLNKINVNGYGLGDVLIPFAKTPANLTKAIIDYSPAGLVSAITKGVKLSRSLTNGQYSAKTQHEFVESLGKAFAGTALYVLGLALANSGIISGDSDEDKDVSNFLKNTLGINSYSIKIGDKSFTYDWAQPIAAPLSIMANIVNSKDKDAALIEGIVGSLDSAGSILLEQSFLQSINDVLNNQDGVISGLITEGLELPARAVPTFLKQIADLVDGTQRQTFEYGKPIKSAFNQIITKIPGLSYTLEPSVDTLGREIQKYGGKNNPFNVFLNPANVNTENISKSGQEIYRLYKETGETNIMPRVAPYYVNKKGEKIVLDTKQRAQYQKISGSIIESNVAKLLELTEYKNMSDKDKASVVNDIVNYSYNIAQNQVLGTELSDANERAYKYSQIGDISDYYAFTNSVDDTTAKTQRESVFNYLYNSELDDNQIAALYSKYYSTEQKLDNLLTLKIPMRQFIKFDSADIQGEYNPKTGKTISGSKKNAVIKYVNDLEGLSKAQKAIIIKSTKQFKFDNYNNDIIRYVNNLSGTANDKKVWLKSIGFDNYDKDVVRYIKSQGLSQEETEKKLDELGFTIRDGRVYY
jgi:hypothetical protein